MNMRYGTAQYSTPPLSNPKKIIPPSSNAQYLTSSTPAVLTWAIWRCNGGANLLNVIFGLGRAVDNTGPKSPNTE